MGPPPPGHPRIAGEERPLQPISEQAYPFRWEFIGPSVIDSEYWSGNAQASGRVNAIVPDPTNPDVAYVSTDGGGVWKTTSDGASWEPLTDGLESLRGGALALSRDDPSTLYWGTGDFRIGSAGAGLYRSTDAGASWTRLAPASEVGSQIAGIVHLRGTTGTILVGGSRGLRRASSPYMSWTTILTGSVTSLWSDATTSQLYVGCSGKGIFRSSDGGATVTQCTSPSFPSTNNFSTVAVSACQADPLTVYAAFVSRNSSVPTTLHRSDDGGLSWTPLPSAEAFCYPQCWYDAYVAADPVDPTVVYIGGVDGRYGVFGVAKSTDRGLNWIDVADAGGTQLHPDHHVMAFGPSAEGGTKIWEGNDGGVWTSSDGAASWSNRNTDLATALLYDIAVHPLMPDRMLGGSQDNGTPERIESGTVWPQLQTGDGGFSAFVPDASGIRFTTYVYGKAYRWDAMDRAVQLTPNWTDPVGWIAPMVLDPSDPDRLYLGTNRPWVCTVARSASPSTDAERAAIWTPLSATNTTANASAVINRIAISPSDPATIYAGCSAGSVWVSRDRGASWSRRSAGLPLYGISGIVVNPYDAAEAWVSQYFGSGGRVYRTLDAGASWSAVGANLPTGVIPRALGVDFHSPGTLRRTAVVGSGAGVYHSLDLGASWVANDASLPNANVGDILVDSVQRSVIVATYGRGAWRSALPSGCPSDLSGDETVFFDDIALIMLDFGPCAGCAADIDGNGLVDLGDIALVMLEFGPCP